MLDEQARQLLAIAAGMRTQVEHPDRRAVRLWRRLADRNLSRVILLSGSLVLGGTASEAGADIWVELRDRATALRAALEDEGTKQLEKLRDQNPDDPGTTRHTIEEMQDAYDAISYGVDDLRETLELEVPQVVEGLDSRLSALAVQIRSSSSTLDDLRAHVDRYERLLESIADNFDLDRMVLGSGNGSEQPGPMADGQA